LGTAAQWQNLIFPASKHGLFSSPLFSSNAVGINTQKTSALGDFLRIGALPKTNREKLLWQQVCACAQCLVQIPNFVVVDFWKSSGILEVVQRMNSMPTAQRELFLNITACHVNCKEEKEQ